MGLEAIRVDVVTKVEALKAAFSGGYTLKIEYDNRDTVDLATQADPFLQVNVKVLEAEQVDLSSNPMHRHRGVINLTATVPLGSGTSKANQLVEHFYKGLHRNSFGSVRTFMGSAAPTKEHLGWAYISFVVPFWSDQPG